MLELEREKGGLFVHWWQGDISGNNHLVFLVGGGVDKKMFGL